MRMEDNAEDKPETIMDWEYAARRDELTDALIDAAEALMRHTKKAGYVGKFDGFVITVKPEIGE